MYAAANGQAEVVNVLIEKGASVDSEDKNGNTPITHAFWKRNEEVCEILLKYVVSFEKLLVGAVFCGDYEMVEFLIDHMASTDREISNRETLLTSAARYGHIEICEFFLNCGMCKSKEDHQKMFQAARNEKTEICKLLVEYGAEINPSDIVEKKMKDDILIWKESFGKK